MVRNKRSKGKIKNDYVNEDIYNYYCSISSLNIPKKIFFAIIKEYILFIVDKMLTEGFLFNMPSRLGTLGIMKTKILFKLDENGNIIKKNFRKDWNATFKLWQTLYPDKTIDEVKLLKDKPYIYHLNKHTQGYNLNFIWDRLSSNVKNQFSYRFLPARTNSRNLAKLVKDPNFKGDYSLNPYKQKA